MVRDMLSQDIFDAMHLKIVEEEFLCGSIDFATGAASMCEPGGNLRITRDKSRCG